MSQVGAPSGTVPDGWSEYLAFTRQLRDARSRWQPRAEYPTFVRDRAAAVMYDVAAFIVWDAPFKPSPANRFEQSLLAARRAAYEFTQGEGRKSTSADLRELATLMGASDPTRTLDEGALMAAVLPGRWADQTDTRSAFGSPQADPRPLRERLIRSPYVWGLLLFFGGGLVYSLMH